MLGGAKLKFEPGADSNIGGATPPQKGLRRTLMYSILYVQYITCTVQHMYMYSTLHVQLHHMYMYSILYVQYIKCTCTVHYMYSTSYVHVQYNICTCRGVETLSQLPDILAYFCHSCPAPHQGWGQIHCNCI